MRAEKIGLRLNAEELATVRKQPGTNDNERIRTLIKNQAMADAITEPVQRQMNDLGRKLDQLTKDVDKVKQREEASPLSDIAQGVGIVHDAVEANGRKIDSNADEIDKAVKQSHGANQEIRAIRGKSSDAEQPPKKGLFEGLFEGQ